MKKPARYFWAICFFLILIVGGLYLVKRVYTFFIYGIDGNEKQRMILISSNYYYYTIDSSLWWKDTKLDYYKPIIKKKIDSLSWNESYIMGYTQSKYFKIGINSNSLQYHLSKFELIKSVDSLPTNSIRELPGIE